MERIDVAIRWGDGPAVHPAGDRHPSVVRVERTHPTRPFWAAGWMRATDRPKPSPTVRLVAGEAERAARDGWADGLALAYVLARALCDGADLEAATAEMRRALPAAWRYRVEPCEALLDPQSPSELARSLFGDADTGTNHEQAIDLHAPTRRKRRPVRGV